MRFDSRGRVHIDECELGHDVQTEVGTHSAAVDTIRISDLVDHRWFHRQARQLFGWSAQDVDYECPVDPSVSWPRDAALA